MYVVTFQWLFFAGTFLNKYNKYYYTIFQNNKTLFGLADCLFEAVVDVVEVISSNLIIPNLKPI